MYAGSPRKFCEAQKALRQETLAKLRATKRSICNLCRQYEVRCRTFVERLNATPRQVVYRYYRTRDALLEHLDRLDELRAFLARKRGGERLLWKGRLLGKTAFANEVVHGQSGTALGEARDLSLHAARKRALRVLEAQRSELQQRLAAHDAAWNRLVDAARSILQGVKELSRRGVVAPDDPAIEYLEEVLCYLYEEQLPWPHRKVHRPDTLTRVQTAFKTLSLQEILCQALGQAAKSVAAGMPGAVAREKRNLLHDAARQLAVRLEAWRERPRFSALEQALLALHFTFTSARQGLGGIGVPERRRYQTALEEAREADVSSAVVSLVQRNVLPENELEVFRYTPSVWQAWNGLRDFGDVGRCKSGLLQNIQQNDHALICDVGFSGAAEDRVP